MPAEHNSHIPQTPRLLNKDGTFNIDRPRNMIITKDIYHELLSMPWRTFGAYILALYIGINLIFGTLYWIAGPGAVSGMVYSNELEHWAECFFFSVQTVATIGYGKLTPNSFIANILVTFEALIGMFAVAMQTGMVFARISRPTSKVVFSHNALIQDHDGQLSLVFRIANARMNQIVEANAHVTLLRTETTKEGETYKNIYDLVLERSNSPVFSLSWTIVHPITKESPLYKLSLEEMAETNTEIFVTITGVDDTFAQNVYSRFSYTPKEIILNHRFVDMIKRSNRGRLTLDLSKIHLVEPVAHA